MKRGRAHRLQQARDAFLDAAHELGSSADYPERDPAAALFFGALGILRMQQADEDHGLTDRVAEALNGELKRRRHG